MIDKSSVRTIEKIAINIGNQIWGSDTTAEVNSGICLMDFPRNLMNISSPCLTTLLAKLLGLAIIAGACLNKAPIIRNVLVNQSVAGLSLQALYGEVIMYGNSAMYGYLQNAPFTAYGENLMVTLQCLVLVMLVWMDPKSKVSLGQQVMAVAVGSAYATLVLTQLSSEYYPIVIMSNWPALLFSRGSQILQSFQLKHTGAQSVITHGMNLVGSLIRIGTTVGEVGYDLPLLSGYAISIVLNTILVAQVLLYQENTAKFLKAEKKQD